MNYMRGTRSEVRERRALTLRPGTPFLISSVRIVIHNRNARCNWRSLVSRKVGRRRRKCKRVNLTKWSILNEFSRANESVTCHVISDAAVHCRSRPVAYGRPIVRDLYLFINNYRVRERQRAEFSNRADQGALFLFFNDDDRCCKDWPRHNG